MPGPRQWAGAAFGCLLTLTEIGFETVLKTSTPHKLNVLYHPALLGLELTSSASPVHYSELDTDTARKTAGRTRNQRLGYGPQQSLARILNSGLPQSECSGA